MVFLLVAAAVVVGAPLAAALLVTVASHHEEAFRTLTGRPPGPITATARRLLRVPNADTRKRRRRSAAADPELGNLTSPYLPRPRTPADDDVTATR
jgi:hypothetical protein